MVGAMTGMITSNKLDDSGAWESQLSPLVVVRPRDRDHLLHADCSDHGTGRLPAVAGVLLA